MDSKYTVGQIMNNPELAREFMDAVKHHHQQEASALNAFTTKEHQEAHKLKRDAMLKLVAAVSQITLANYIMKGQEKAA